MNELVCFTVYPSAPNNEGMVETLRMHTTTYCEKDHRTTLYTHCTPLTTRAIPSEVSIGSHFLTPDLLGPIASLILQQLHIPEALA
jgi:hypothetical protein